MKLAKFSAIMLWFALIAGYFGATADPIVRKTNIRVVNYPAGLAPTRLVLLSDIHMVGPDMSPERLAHIVDIINATHPDIVVIAGDFMSGRVLWTRRYNPRQTVAPLHRLSPRLGIVAVLGNHDHGLEEGELKSALKKAGITVLTNTAVSIGPLAVAGADDRLLNRPTMEPALRALRQTPGVPVLVSHYPSGFRWLPEDVPLMLAGHTHCGQIAYRLSGGLGAQGLTGRYACGVSRSGNHALVTTAGLGTSIVPLRIGVPPDIWLITIGR